MTDKQTTIPIGELIAGAFRQREAERVLNQWREEGHPSVIRRLEISSFPERASAEEKSHLASCADCRAAVERSLRKMGESAHDESVNAQPTRRPVSIPYQLAPAFGAAAKAGVDAVSSSEPDWATVELSDGPLEVAVHRADIGVRDVWIRLQKRGDPGLCRAIAVKLGAVHRLCILVPDDNNFWTAEQKVEGTAAKRLSEAGEMVLEEIDLADLGAEHLPLLVESLDSARRRNKLCEALHMWLAGHENTQGADVVRQALASS